MKLRELAASLAASLTVSACVTVAPPPEDEGLPSAPSYEALPRSEPGWPSGTPFVGLELAEALSGGLDSLEFMAGLRIAAVAPGSPAEEAGLVGGDRLLSVDGAKLERLDQWTALLSSAAPGAQWQLELERDGAVRRAALTVRSRSVPEPTTTDRFLERRLLRCSATTTALAGSGATRLVARLDELADDSPLHAAGVGPGVAIVALDGTPVVGAADLFARVSRMEPGQEVALDVLDRLDANATPRRVEVELHQPERHLTKLSLWPLISWSETPDEQKGEIVVLDLWLIWLWKRTHDGPTTQTSILRFLAWESGVGALEESGK
ncbi:MAG: PDZ domain-containing protein [Planctomycetes bacterium]|nr:PDZ domain-containing protein [Planctomycetota bacterium]